MNKTFFSHQPIMLNQILATLNPQPQQTFIDATCGLGGYMLAILKQTHDQAHMIGIDYDAKTITALKNILVEYTNYKLYHLSYDQIDQILTPADYNQIDGVILDLGISSMQLDNPAYGLSYKTLAPLDMRLDPTHQTTSAYDVVNKYSNETLITIFRDFGEERLAKPIANRICYSRETTPITTTLALAKIICQVYQQKQLSSAKHPARKIFQALRIYVNQELLHLQIALPKFYQFLKPSAKLFILTFHSLEEKLVHQFYQSMNKPKLQTLPKLALKTTPTTKKIQFYGHHPILPLATEIAINPRARSAKLWILEKCDLNLLKNQFQRG